MIKHVIFKKNLKNYSEIKENLAYWLKQTPEARISAVELFRKQYYGNSERLQRTARIIQRAPR